MYSRNPDYRSFLVRMWMEHGSTHPENADQEPLWRFSVEDPRTGERRGFAQFANVIDFLQAHIGKPVENTSLDAQERANQDNSNTSNRHAENE